MSQSFTVFFFEDDLLVADRITKLLEQTTGEPGAPVFVVAHYAQAEDAFAALDKYSDPPAIALLDVHQPNFTGAGLKLCKEIKARWPVPVVHLSALDELRDQIRARAYGGKADDYISKAFLDEPDFGELLRVVLSGLIRNYNEAAGFDPDQYRTGSLEVHMDIPRVRWRGTDVRLTRTQMGILDEVAKPANAGRLRRHHVLASAGGMSATDRDQIKITVRQHIRAIRKAFEKIDKDFKEAWQNERYGPVAVAGVGYRWISDSPSDQAGPS